MIRPEDPLSLLAILKEQYGVDESCAPFGPSVVVPNKDFKREWSLLLQQAGYRMYVGEQNGQVAWIIPLKPRARLRLGSSFTPHGLQGPSETQTTINPGMPKDPRGNGASTQTSTPLLAESAEPGRGCVTGRPWTQAEDREILAMLSQNKSAREIAKELTSKLDRTEGAIETRVRRLKRRIGKPAEPKPAQGKPLETSLEKGVPQGPQPSSSELRSLLESALLLSDDPKHKPALKLILEASLRLASVNREK